VTFWLDERSKVADGVDGNRMKRASPITTLFLDIGGVLLPDGWDHHARKLQVHPRETGLVRIAE
jgi:hypothetical protein